MSANTQWIWLNGREENAYVEFRKTFSFLGGTARLRIAADRQFAAFINGKLVANAQFADAYGYKSVTMKEITPFLGEGENLLTVIALHTDSDFALARTTTAGLFFEIYIDDRLVAFSDTSVEARVSPQYKIGVPVTPQLGYGYEYDFTANGEWSRAELVPAHTLVERPIKECLLSEPVPSEVVAQGIFKYRGGETAAEKAQNAWLSSLRFAEMTGKNRVQEATLKAPVCFTASGGDGVFVLVDLGQERAGYAHFSIRTKEACKGIFAWGEHLTDLRVRAAVGGRHFAAPFTFKQGKNEFNEYLHRLGARYLCLFIESDEVVVERLTVREFSYPFKVIARKFDDRLLEQIYQTGVRTLQLCAHEHYEDCPWREQGFYAMDSRNQALYGYSAFGEYELPRALLRLIAQSTREDGLPELCTPARAFITIPSYAPYWIMALKENADGDFRREFVGEMLPYAEKMMQTFASRTQSWGVSAFVEPCYWNFHEWSEGMYGDAFNRTDYIEPYGDGMLTALVLIAARCMQSLYQRIDGGKKADDYKVYAERLGACLEAYYDEETGLYATYIKNGKRTGLHSCAQAAYILTDCIPMERARAMCAEIKNPVKTVPMTFGELQFKYEAILKVDGDKQYCLDDACALYGRMLFRGATSFWETEYGEADFNDGGSLCHAWSSVVCWLFDKLGVAKKVEE